MAGIEVLVSCTRVPKFPVAQIAGARLHFSSVLSQSILGCENTFAAFILATFHQFMFCYQNACVENMDHDLRLSNTIDDYSEKYGMMGGLVQKPVTAPAVPSS